MGSLAHGSRRRPGESGSMSESRRFNPGSLVMDAPNASPVPKTRLSTAVVVPRLLTRIPRPVNL